MNLNGYAIRAVVHQDNNLHFYDQNKSGYDRCIGADAGIACTMFKHINASLVVKQSDDFGRIDVAGKPQGSVGDVLSSTVDIALFGTFIRDYWKLQTYPFHFHAIKILSLKDSVKYNDAIVVMFTLKVLLVLISSCLVGVFGLKYYFKLSSFAAASEILQMLTGTSYLIQQRISFGALILFSFQIYLFGITTFIQIFLSSSATVAYQNPYYIDSVEDLIESKYHVYGQKSHKELILQTEIRNRYHFDGYFGECAERLLKGDHIVCVHPELYVKLFLEESKLIHISKSNVAERSYSYTCREDFPLISKFNRILSHLKKGGFIAFFYKRYEDELIRKLREYDEEAVEALSVMNTAANFYILLISCAMAVFVFLFEIGLHKIKHLISRQRQFPWTTNAFIRRIQIMKRCILDVF